MSSRALSFTSGLAKDLASSFSHNEFRIDGRKMEIVSSSSHRGHIISSSDGNRLDIMKQKRVFNDQVNNMLCFLGSSRPWSNHICSLRIVDSPLPASVARLVSTCTERNL